MSPRHERYASPASAGRQPVFNLPPVLVWTLVVLFAVHLLREYVLDSETARQVAPGARLHPDPGHRFRGRASARRGGRTDLDLRRPTPFFTPIGRISSSTRCGSPLSAVPSPGASAPVRFLGFLGRGAPRAPRSISRSTRSDIVPLVGASAAISAHMAGAAVSHSAGRGRSSGFRGRVRRPIAGRRRRSSMALRDPTRPDLPRRLVRHSTSSSAFSAAMAALPPARSPGRPISAASSPVSCSFRSSIPVPRRPASLDQALLRCSLSMPSAPLIVTRRRTAGICGGPIVRSVDGGGRAPGSGGHSDDRCPHSCSRRGETSPTIAPDKADLGGRGRTCRAQDRRPGRRRPRPARRHRFGTRHRQGDRPPRGRHPRRPGRHDHDPRCRHLPRERDHQRRS